MERTVKEGIPTKQRFTRDASLQIAHTGRYLSNTEPV